MNIPSIPFLDILISIILIYALLSILVSVINEILSTYLEHRSKMLNYSINKLLKDDKNLSYGELFYNHINIQAITKLRPRKDWFGLIDNDEFSKKKTLPTYISSSVFADSLIDIIANQAKHLQQIEIKVENGIRTIIPVGIAPPNTLMEKFSLAIKSMNPSPFRDLLQSFNDRSNNKVEELKPILESWFNDYQDRVTGWYKVKQRKRMLWVGLFTAVILNVDSLHLVKVLSLDDKLRGQLVATSEKVADNYSGMNDSLKSNTAALITLFSDSDTLVKATADSLSRGQQQIIVENPKMLTDVLYELDSTRYSKIRKVLLYNDSISKDLQQQTDDVLGIAASLNIPIGYSQTSAPLSWFCRYKSKIKPLAIKVSNTGLIAYNQQRNAGADGWIYFKYFLGIVITGFSLSAGAPFWFDMLVKFVNVRRAGVKPDSTDKKQK